MQVMCRSWNVLVDSGGSTALLCFGVEGTYLYTHRVPEVADTFLICVLVHPTEVYPNSTGRNVDLQLTDVRYPGSPAIPSALCVSCWTNETE